MIREASLKDTSQLLDLAYEYYKEADMKGVEFDSGVCRQSIYNAVINEELRLVVVEKDNKIVGFAYNEIVSPAFSTDTVMENRILYLHPEWRKGSLGISLIKYLERDAKMAGVAYFYLGVTSGIHTERTAKLYEQLGYERIGYDYRKGVKQ